MQRASLPRRRTLVKWFGVGPADIATVHPNHGPFGTPDLGFMG